MTPYRQSQAQAPSTERSPRGWPRWNYFLWLLGVRRRRVRFEGRRSHDYLFSVAHGTAPAVMYYGDCTVWHSANAHRRAGTMIEMRLLTAWERQRERGHPRGLRPDYRYDVEF